MIIFPKSKNTKSFHSPWITKGIAKSSNRNQKLYEKYLKRRTNETKTAYKLYKNLFESMKWKSKYPPLLIDKVIKKYLDYKFSSNQNQFKRQV